MPCDDRDTPMVLTVVRGWCNLKRGNRNKRQSYTNHCHRKKKKGRGNWGAHVSREKKRGATLGRGRAEKLRDVRSIRTASREPLRSPAPSLMPDALHATPVPPRHATAARRAALPLPLDVPPASPLLRCRAAAVASRCRRRIASCCRPSWRDR